MMHMHHDDLPPSCACTALRKASRTVTRLYDERLAGDGITTTQFAILRTLLRSGDMPLSRLAETLAMDRTSLYRTLAPIERAGWIAIAAGNGRSRVAALTDAGRAEIAKAEPAWREAQARILTIMGEEQWAQLLAMLDQLAKAERSGEQKA